MIVKKITEAEFTDLYNTNGFKIGVAYQRVEAGDIVYIKNLSVPATENFPNEMSETYDDVSDIYSVQPSYDSELNYHDAYTPSKIHFDVPIGSGTPKDGQLLVLRIKPLNPGASIPVTWNMNYRFPAAIGTLSANSKIDYIRFVYNAGAGKWDYWSQTQNISE
jgi:hypothetical protein